MPRSRSQIIRPRDRRKVRLARVRPARVAPRLVLQALLVLAPSAPRLGTYPQLGRGSCLSSILVLLTFLFCLLCCLVLFPQSAADALRRPALARPPLAAATTCCACMPTMPPVSRCTPRCACALFLGLVDCVSRLPLVNSARAPNISKKSDLCRHSCHELTKCSFCLSLCPLYSCVLPLASGPTAVLVMSLLFIGLVVFLHIWGKFRKSIS